MALYPSYTFECDECELETNSFCDLSEAVAQLENQGWTMRDNGVYALCEECSE